MEKEGGGEGYRGLEAVLIEDLGWTTGDLDDVWQTCEWKVGGIRLSFSVLLSHYQLDNRLYTSDISDCKDNFF